MTLPQDIFQALQYPEDRSALGYKCLLAVMRIPRRSNIQLHSHLVGEITNINKNMYRQFSNVRRTKSPNINIFRLVL